MKSRFSPSIGSRRLSHYHNLCFPLSAEKRSWPSWSTGLSNFSLIHAGDSYCAAFQSKYGAAASMWYQTSNGVQDAICNTADHTVLCSLFIYMSNSMKFSVSYSLIYKLILMCCILCAICTLETNSSWIIDTVPHLFDCNFHAVNGACLSLKDFVLLTKLPVGVGMVHESRLAFI